MNNKERISFHRWNKKDRNKLFNSLNNILNLRSAQFYIPFFSLYTYIHNKPNAFKTIDLRRKYEIREILEITKEKYYNSNMYLLANVYDSGKNIIKEEEIFCKTIPIIDEIHYLNNNYNFVNKKNHYLPSNYNYNTFSKINNINNKAYIDIICSFLFSNLVQKKKLPSFPLFYGSVNGIGNYNYDISDEYYDLRIDKCFRDNIGKGFHIDIYKDNSSSDESSDESSDGSVDSNDDYIAIMNNIPLQLLFIEKLDGTLEDLFKHENIDNLLISCLFQIAFALSYLQKYYDFTHNDLHINNIMYSSTEFDYLYYKLNNKYFKVPTYGKIFKIIDYGRSIFTYHNKVYMNDVFSIHGEAGGQYTYSKQVEFLKDDSKDFNQEPSKHFDLCRLAITILDELSEENIKNENLCNLLKLLSTDKFGNNFCNSPDNFELYINISKNAINSLPKDILQNELFNPYRVKKKNFPRKSYYSLN